MITVHFEMETIDVYVTNWYVLNYAVVRCNLMNHEKWFVCTQTFLGTTLIYEDVSNVIRLLQFTMY